MLVLLTSVYPLGHAISPTKLSDSAGDKAVKPNVVVFWNTLPHSQISNSVRRFAEPLLDMVPEGLKICWCEAACLLERAVANFTSFERKFHVSVKREEQEKLE